jgi:hypothetical protein
MLGGSEQCFDGGTNLRLGLFQKVEPFLGGGVQGSQV